MAITEQDIRAYGIASPASSDLTSPVGGAISLARLVEWATAKGLFNIVSSDAGDTGLGMGAEGLDIGGNVFTDSAAVLGTTPTPITRSFAQIMHGFVSPGTALGDTAIESQTPTRTGTAVSGAASEIELDAGASAVNGFYNGQIIRLDTGTGQFQIRQIIRYVGATKIATVDRPWGTTPDGTSTFVISKGNFFPGPGAPNQINQVWRLFANAVNPPAVGPTKVLYDKFFFRNDHATDAAPAAQVIMVDPTGGSMAFGLAAAVNDVLITTTRLTPPTGISFGTSPVAVPGGTLAAGARIGVWVRLTRPALAPTFDLTSTFTLGWT